MIVDEDDYEVTDPIGGGGIIDANNPIVGYENVVSISDVFADAELADKPVTNLVNPSTHLMWESPNNQSQAIEVNVTGHDVDYLAIARHNFLNGCAPSLEGATGANVDPFSKAHLHLDGEDGSTVITDDNTGGSAKIWTAFDNARISTGTFKFGDASLLLDGVNDYVSTPDHADFTLGSADFTVQAYFNVSVAGGTVRTIAGQVDAAGIAHANSAWVIHRTVGNVIAASVVQGTTVTTVTGTTQFTHALNPGWHHVEFVRFGNVLKLFIDGVLEGGDIAFVGDINDSSAELAVGRPGSSNNEHWQGNIDEFRFSPGIARHTTGFNVEQFPYDSEFNYFEIVPSTVQPSGEPIIFRFNTRNDLIRLRVKLFCNGEGDPPTAAVLFAGKLLVLQRRIYVGHGPMRYNRKSNIITGFSETGQFLGRILIGETSEASFSMDNLTPSYFRTFVDPWLRSAQTRPFFFAWRPSSYPLETAFCWSNNDAKAVNQRSNGMMQISLALQGLAQP